MTYPLTDTDMACWEFAPPDPVPLRWQALLKDERGGNITVFIIIAALAFLAWLQPWPLP